MSYYTKKPEITLDPVERLSKINVLVLDGGAKAATLIKSIFAALGLQNIFIANDGHQGVQVMKEIRIHVIFTDRELKMNRDLTERDSMEKALAMASAASTSLTESGAKFVERIRKSPQSPNPFIPIVMMMDQAVGSEIIQARDAGVNEVLLRPLNAEDFCNRLIAIIQKPRPFITAKSYRGPCRRRNTKPLNRNVEERRVREVKLIRSVAR
jgi:CheY-like chemotaxis protein